MLNRDGLRKIKYLIIDVDGTMTDAGIYYDEHGNELKKFCTKDAAGYMAAHKAGIKLMVLTGRECQATTRRMQEMKFDYIVQKIQDKSAYLKEFMVQNQLSGEEVGYIGDDLNDLSPMKLCSFVGCPADACEEVKAAADYISEIKGGYGAVRDIISAVLKRRGDWEQAVEDIYGIGI
ncbi:MAG: HAD hydrolase family protein [Anaeroplasmataceae bacterium]|nr:HAD hydrolase family protein [Anaeroplasmataceae bacterium]